MASFFSIQAYDEIQSDCSLHFKKKYILCFLYILWKQFIFGMTYNVELGGAA